VHKGREVCSIAKTMMVHVRVHVSVRASIINHLPKILGSTGAFSCVFVLLYSVRHLVLANTCVRFIYEA
jgi:hypothetical protein